MPQDNSTHMRVDKIHPDPNQPRKQFDQAAHDLLVESVRHHGVLAPLRIRMVCGRAEIIDGERRWRAAKAAGLELVPVIIEERELSEGEILLQSLTANLARADLNPMEKAEALRASQTQTGRPMAEVSRMAGISESHAAKLLALLRLSEADQQRVRDGVLSLSSAYALAVRKPRNHRPKPRARVHRPAGTRFRLAPGAVMVLRAGASPLDRLADVLSEFVMRLRGAHHRGEPLPQWPPESV